MIHWRSNGERKKLEQLANSVHVVMGLLDLGTC